MISPNYTTDYFSEGNEVIFVPKHAFEEFADWLKNNRPDWVLKYSKFQKGVVSSKNGKFVFVRYFVNEILQETSQGTDPQDLILWKK